MNRSSALERFNAAKKLLLEEREALLERIAEINQVLGVPIQGRGTGLGVPGRGNRAGVSPRRGYRRNPTSLKELVLQVMQSGPKTAREILDAVQAAGYRFTTPNPLNSLRTLLYKAEGIKREDGKFGPA